MTLKLWDFQAEAVEALDRAECQRPAAVLPTGSGKTIIFGALADRLVRRAQRPLILVHREELAFQAQIKVGLMVPDARIGIVKASQNDVDADIIVGSVWTLASPERRSQITNIGAVIVDECHHATAPSYIDVLTHYGCIEGNTKAYGVTATMSRVTGNRNLGDVWDDIVYTKDIQYMIRHGYLVNPTGYTVEVSDLDMESVRRSDGDYSAVSLSEALGTSSAARRVVEAWLERCPERRTVAFCPTVASAQQLAESFADAGVSVEVVTGSTSTEERQAIFRRLRSRETRVICNCMVLTEGWDEPSVDCAVIMRLTQSQALYVQMVGRVLRTSRSTGKTDAVILDIAGNARKHGLRSLSCLTRTNPERLRDGEDLINGTARLAAEECAVADPLVTPEVERIELTEVDLFGSSEWSFQQTYGGTWFGSSPKRFYWIWPVSSGYIVRGTENDRKIGTSILLTPEAVPIDLAFSIAEGAIEKDNMSSRFRTGKSASWKRRRPSEAQINYARKLGLLQRMPDGTARDREGKPLELKTQGELSVMIDRLKMSRMLAPYEDRKS